MSQSEYQILISHLYSTWSNYSRCLISKSLQLFPTEIQAHGTDTYATSSILLK